MEQSVLKNFSNYGETENRQSRPNPIEVGWLAGIIDGEGCLTATWVKNRKRPDTQHVGVHLRIGNTDLEVLKKAQRIIQGLCNIKYEIKIHHRATENLCFRVDVTKQTAIRDILEVVMPFLTGAKRSQAEAIMEFVLVRKTNKHTGIGYTQVENTLVDRLKVMKRSGFVKASGGLETEREALREANSVN